MIVTAARPASTTGPSADSSPGPNLGDSVEVWFEGGGETSESFTYQAVEESGDDVLILAAEDYTGASPVQAGGPNYLDFYQAALEANGTGLRRLRR